MRTFAMVDSRTAVYVVFGDPVSHSLSPIMQNRAFEHVGFNGVYIALRVKDPADAIRGMRAFDFQGASVTIPHKIEVIRYLDELDAMAEKIGAVNTIVNQRGRLIGYNSDCLGAVKALSRRVSVRGKRIALLGAGGAARAIGFGIVKEGGALTVFNMTRTKGERLAQDVGATYRPISEFSNTHFDVLINATPVGMFPNTEAMPIQKEELNEKLVVMDIVYNPLRTKLLKTAEKLGCKTVDGLSMFVYQGAHQFELWTGMEAPVDVMTRAVFEILEKQKKGGR
jgi:shikimate dehydrogenase